MALNNTQLFTYMHAYMEDATKYDNYYLQELKSDGFVYTSYFQTKDSARYYAREFCSESSAVYIFKSSCVKIYDPVADHDYEEVEEDLEYKPENDFSEMVLWKYGKGYILVPPTSSDYYGNKYFHNGWWMPSQNAWFFKASFYDWLASTNVMFAEGDYDEQEHEEHEEHETSDNVDLSDMTLWTYGKGYLLEPPTSSDYYGEKYFHNGWWMSSQNGWFFKASFYDWLINHGVHVSVEESDVDIPQTPAMTPSFLGDSDEEEDEEEEEEESDEEEEEDSDEEEEEDDEEEDEEEEESEFADFSDMTLRKYGKGYLVIPPKSSQFYGEKYLCQDEIGWWMPKQRGWFFKIEYYEWLLNCGVNMCSKTSKNEDLSKMSLEEYGRGYILKTAESDPLYGQKYFMKGFWNTKQHGWFIQSKYYEDLISMGAKYIKQENDSEEEPTTLSSSITQDNFEYVHSDSEFVEGSGLAMPKFIKYGKGWILKADSNYTFNGNKYYEGGFWIPSIKGWFFKSEQKKKFMTEYFDI